MYHISLGWGTWTAAVGEKEGERLEKTLTRVKYDDCVFEICNGPAVLFRGCFVPGLRPYIPSSCCSSVVGAAAEQQSFCNVVSCLLPPKCPHRALGLASISANWQWTLNPNVKIMCFGRTTHEVHTPCRRMSGLCRAVMSLPTSQPLPTLIGVRPTSGYQLSRRRGRACGRGCAFSVLWPHTVSNSMPKVTYCLPHKHRRQ